MRLLLANGATISIKSYNNTTAIVSGNSVPALSIVVNEPIETAKEKFDNADAFIDFNIYPDDKNVSLLHAIGYQKRVSMAIEDDENTCTVILAKTTETDQILSRVEKTLETIEGKNKVYDAAISDINKGLNDLSAKHDTTTEKLTSLNNAVAGLLDALESVRTDIVNVTDHISANDKLCEDVKKSIDGFTEISAQQIAEVQSLRNEVAAATKTATDAVNTADSAANTVVAQTDAIQQAVDVSGTAKDATDALNVNVSAALESLAQVTDQVNDVAKAAADLKINTASAEVVDNISYDVECMKDNVKKASDDISAITDTVDDINTKLPEIDNKLETMANKTDTVAANQDAIKETADTAAEAATKVADDLTSVNERLTALEPITDYTTLSLEDAKEYRVNESASDLEAYLSEHPITSTCHQGISAQYSITKDKQDYLQAMINMTKLSQESGIPYQPSWNATGEVCSYDWTLEELCQLAMEIEAVVRPLVSYQQTLEKEIRSVETMEDLKNVVIDYSQAPSHTTDTSESETADNTASEAIEE